MAEKRVRTPEQKARDKELAAKRRAAMTPEEKAEKLAKRREYSKANQKRIAMRNARYRRENREKVRESHREWKKRNPEKVKAQQERVQEARKEFRLAPVIIASGTELPYTARKRVFAITMSEPWVKEVRAYAHENGMNFAQAVRRLAWLSLPVLAQQRIKRAEKKGA